MSLRMPMPDRFTFGSTSLIQLVEQRPCLWDPSNPDYKMKKAKEVAWNEIYRHMQNNFDSMPKSKQISLGNQITHRWYNIRDSYVKYVKGHYGNRTRPYLYHEYLAFLGGVIQSKNIESISEVTMDSENEEEQYSRIREVLEENVLENEEEESSLNITPAKRGVKRKSEDPMAEVLLKLLKKNQDEDEAFFTSITPEVKRMSTDNKLQFRIEVMKLIRKLMGSDLKAEVESDDGSD